MQGEPGGRQSLLAWLEARINLTEIASFLSVFGLLPTELDSRKPLREALRDAFHQPLPSYAQWPRVLGIVSFILFLFLAATGTLLSFYYQPTADVAYASVTTISRDVQFGFLIRQTHGWAATLFLLVLAARVIRFFLGGLYARGREIIWMAAVLAFVVGTFLDLTGRLLPWNDKGYWTTVRAREVIDGLPVIGSMVAFLVGGTGLDSLALTRFYVLHIAVFPALILGLFYLHFSSVRRVGMSRLAAPPLRAGRSIRLAMYDMVLILIVLVGVLLTLAIVWPQPYAPAADPLRTLPDAHPPWYLLAPHAVLESLPSFVPRFLRGLLLVTLLGGVLFLPFLDRSAGGDRRNRLFFILGVLVMVTWVLLTFRGYWMEVSR
ncbi:MAG TPA: cytochrome b N-terminal domain-containing protein [Candidatus Eisenbacteria bacterium]|nr:cytochrome b N-terminal domain-containing protein [Candidatus Eisenbacteria bacterium]